MNKILKINFRNAKLFPFDRNGKDFVSDMGVREKRKGQLMFKEPITVHQISNMLHKMMGERPVPSFRYVPYKRQEDIFKIAQNSYLKINNIKKYNKNKDRYEFVKETIQIKKSAHDAWNKVPNVFWDKIKKYMGDHFNEFIKRFSDIMGFNVLDKPFMLFKGCGIGKETSFNELNEWLRTNKLAPIVNFFMKETMVISEITKNGSLGETTIKAVTNCNILSGVIYVPITDEQLSRFVYNTATILDGGFAIIEGVYYEEELVNDDDIEGAIKVSEISDEKAKEVIW